MRTRISRWKQSASHERDAHALPKRHRRGFRSSRELLVVYAGLVTLFLVSVLLSLRLEGNEVVQRFAPNFATETFAIIVTLAVVQRLLERQERARRLRAAVGAVRKTRGALAGLVELWATILKGSLDPRRTEYPRTLYELFAPHHTEELACLDPNLQYEVGAATGETWLQMVVQQISSMQHALRSVILAYGATLEADYLEALDELVDDPFADLVLALGTRAQLSPEEWRLRLNQSRGYQEAHFIRLLHALQLHNQLALEVARFRSHHLGPRAQSLALQLGTSRDLLIDSELPAGWWSTAPPVGSLRIERMRGTLRSG